MEFETPIQTTGDIQPPGAQPDSLPVTQAIGAKEIRKFVEILHAYNSGLAPTKQRIIASEQWWKLRNTQQEQAGGSRIGRDGGFASRSAWLHNVIVSKHADAMENYPEAKMLPREEADKEEAQRLTEIVPCILERNDFEEEYSKAMWQKAKCGTGAYKVIWDPDAVNGMGDISVFSVNLLDLYWEPGKRDIQDSRYLFHTELEDKDVLLEAYPELEGKLKSNGFVSARFLYDDTVSTSGKHTVIEVYYHKTVDGRKVLHYCKFVGDQVLYATENDPELFRRGLYDHGMYPYVFDPLFPIEGSPCGYGFVDVCRNPQEIIDTLRTASIKNAVVGATPRYFVRQDGDMNEDEFLDIGNPIVHVNNLDERAIRRIEHNNLDGNYLSIVDGTIQELRETSGNTETSTGNIQSGITAASAIAALQEASGKGSRDSSRSSYRGYRKVVAMVIELIRQFYDLPRQFRITGQNGMKRFITYTNQSLTAQPQGMAFGMDLGYRLPVFDIIVSAQRQNAYSTVAQNELALQLYQLGIFNPQMADQALMVLDMMDFRGKEEIMQKVGKNGTMMQKLLQYLQMAFSLAQTAAPEMIPMIAQDLQRYGGGLPMAGGLAPGKKAVLSGAEEEKEEHSRVKNARERSHNASAADGGMVSAGGKA